MLPRHFRFTPALAFLLSALIFPASSYALDPDRAITQTHIDYWGQKQGFPGGAVNAITQTTDGYLWIGGQNGLVRFDGQRFTLYSRQSAASFPEGPVLGLRADRTGGLWIRLHSPGLFRYHDGSFEPMLTGASDITGVTALGTGVRGEVLLARFGDPLRFQDGLLSHLLQSGEPHQITISIEETSDNVLWIGTRDAGLLGYRDGKLFTLDRLPDRKVNCLLRGRDGSLWIGTDSGLLLWTGSELQRPRMPPSLSHVEVSSLAGDRDGNVWIGTARGLARITDRGEISQEWPAAGVKSPVSALFEDREGNLWVGRANGIERYRDAAFQSYPTAPGHESENYGPLCTDARGRLWFGPSAGGLSWLRSTEKHSVLQGGLPDDIVYSIACGLKDLWLGRQKGGLIHLIGSRQDFKTENFTARNGLARGPVYVVHQSRDGSVWAGTANGGVSRLENGRITTYTTRNGLASDAITAIEQTRDGTVWVATLDGLMSFVNGSWQTHAGDSGLPPARINCLFVDANDVLWIGTEAGLAFSKDGRAFTAPRLPVPLQANIFGIVSDSSGYFWLTADNYLLRVSRSALMGASALPGADSETEPLRQFDVPDGLPGIGGVRRHHSVVKDSMGRIWFSLQGGIAVVNPARIPSRSPSALLHVEEVNVDGRSVNTRKSLRLKPNGQRIEFSYIGLSFSAPENVRYRYRLDGFDHEWAAASPSTRAVYTNLGPGTYCFRVISSNSAGIWNSTEAKFFFHIDPYLWQTFWFRSAAILLASAGLVAIYRLRLHQLTTELNARFEERFAERSRIARELHDTLLQSLHGLMFRYQAARNMLPQRPEQAMTVLDGAITRTEQALAESRDAIKDLRGESLQLDLAESLAQIGQEFTGSQPDQDAPAFSLTVEGQSRPLSSMIHDEAYRIAREILANAFRHAHARRIETEIRYDRHSLRLRFRDDGVGIDPAILNAGGRPGHWGLPGIRERAQKIGASLDFWSNADAGTEVQLAIPAAIAYSTTRARARFRPIRRWKNGVR